MAIDVGTETATAAPAPVAAPAPAKPATGGGWGVPLAVLITGMFMSVLDISIVNVAIPTMQLDFSATTEEIQWVENAYSLALGVVVPVSAWFAGRFGPGRVYIWSPAGLRGRVRAVRAGLGPREHRRLPRGAGHPRRHPAGGHADDPLPDRAAGDGSARRWACTAWASSSRPAIGPTLGGYLVEYVDWRLIFLINVPVGILGAIAAVLFLPQLRAEPDGSVRLARLRAPSPPAWSACCWR